MEAVKEKPQLQKYPANKDSGVEWLGEIPAHWELKRMKYLFAEINERSTDGKQELLSVSQFTGVTKKSDKVGEGDLLTNASTLEGYKIVRKGDLVTNIMLAWNGSLGFSLYHGITSPAYSIYHLLGNNSKRYFHYLLRTERYKAEFKRNSSGVIESRLRLYSDDFFRIISLLPPKPEQTTIAHFLDEKCGKIDTAIAQKQQLIELLKERKQIIIQNAVTKGLDPDVKMKNSGVEWIGEIPEGWEVKKIKHLIKNAFSGGTPSTDKLDYWNGGIPWVSSVDVKMDYLRNTAREISFKGLSNSSAKLAPKGAIVFVTRSGILQHTFPISILQRQMAINQDIKCLVLNEIILPEFFKQIIKGNNSKILVEVRQQAATVESIDMEAFFNLSITIPPKIVQKQISEYIETITQKVQKATELQVQQIKKLKEYKSSLIDTAVTGKIKVG